MENQTIQRIKDTLASHEKIAIAVGKNATLDEMGAALALFLSLTANGKQITVAAPSDPLVEVSSLVGINKVKKSLDAQGGDLVVSFPYKEGEIEKVSYTLENNFLNIIVKTNGKSLSFTSEDVQFTTGGSIPTLLIVVGSPRLSDLGNLFNPEALKDVSILNIDNKADNQGYGDIVVVSPRFSSVSEQVGHLLQVLSSPIDQDIAQNLLSGILFATDNFQKPATSYVALETAAFLMRKGAVRVKQQTDSSFFPPMPAPQMPHSVKPRQQDTRNTNDFSHRQQPIHQQHQQKSSMPFPRNIQPKDDKKEQDAPPDWLTPKVYKGSSLI